MTITTDFIEAVKTNNYPLAIQMLNEKKASPSTNDAEGESVLHCAAALNNTNNIVLTLLCAGADPKTISGKTQNTPLSCACINKNETNIKALLSISSEDLGFVLSHQNIEGKAPLQLAIESGCSPETIKLLVQSGAEVTATLIALVFNHKDISYLDVLLSQLNRNILSALLNQDIEGEALLQIAMRTNCGPEIIQLLLNKGAKPNKRILKQALKMLNGKVSWALLDYIEKNNEYLPLITSTESDLLTLAIQSYRGQKQIKKMLEFGAIPFLPAIFLHKGLYADLILTDSGKGAAEIIKQIQQPSNKKNSALRLAIKSGCSEEIIKLLLTKGYCLQPQDLFWTCQTKYSHFFVLLWKHCCNSSQAKNMLALHDDKGQTLLTKAIINQLPDNIIKLLIQEDNCNLANTHGHTPLYLAVITNNAITVNDILSISTVTLHTKSSGEETPLQFATKTNQTDMLEILINYGCDFDEEPPSLYWEALSYLSYDGIKRVLSCAPAELLAHDLYSFNANTTSVFQQKLNKNENLDDSQRKTLNKIFNREAYFFVLHTYFLQKIKETTAAAKQSYALRVEDFSNLIKCMLDASRSQQLNFGHSIANYYSGSAIDFPKKSSKSLSTFIKVPTRSTQVYQTHRDRIKKMTPEDTEIIQRRFNEYMEFLKIELYVPLSQQATQEEKETRQVATDVASKINIKSIEIHVSGMKPSLISGF